MAFSDEWRDLVDNVDVASAEPINQIAHEVINIFSNNVLANQELTKVKSDIENLKSEDIEIKSNISRTELAVSDGFKFAQEERDELAERINIDIITSLPSSNAIIVEHNQEARLGTLDNLILVFETIPEIFTSYVCFTASDNFTGLQIVHNGKLFRLVLKGDDVSSNGTFTPVVGTTYEIAFKNINTTSLNNEETSLVVARVGAV